MDVVAEGLRPRTLPELRDHSWLQDELEHLWRGCFPDVVRANHVEARYYGSWKNRLGVISLNEDEGRTHIGVNSLLRLPDVPYYVSTITLAHEMVHYAHGFGSPLPRRHKHPHRGRVVEKELVNRGLGSDYGRYLDWVTNRWFDFYSECLPTLGVTPGAYPYAPESFNSRG